MLSRREQGITLEELDRRNDRRQADAMRLHADTTAKLRKGNEEKARFNNPMEHILENM